MKIKIKDGRVVCDLADLNWLFWRRMEYKYFVGGTGSGTPYAYLKKVGTEYKSASEAENDLSTLAQIMMTADLFGVEVESEVREYREILRAEYAALRKREEANAAKRKREEAWRYRCKFGCGKCEGLYYNCDAAMCKHTGEELEQREVPYYDYKAHVGYVFNREAFPSERCPYRAEGQTE